MQPRELRPHRRPQLGGVDELICYVQFGYLSDGWVMRTIELLGKEVLPALAKEGVDATIKPAPAPDRRTGPDPPARGLTP